MSILADQTIKHLELIQAIVTRMAGNSFLLKGWTVALVSALFALASKDADVRYVLVSYFPVIMFWVLDGYFLYQERLFRKLYDKIRTGQGTATDFSMSTVGLVGGKATWISGIFSTTLLVFYGVAIFTISIVMFWLCRK